MASPVYFWNLRTSMKAPYDRKIRRLLKKAGAAAHLESGNLTAVKIHFGEKGGTGFISPLRLAPILAFLKKTGAKPFLTDANTLYVGERGEAVSHTMCAHRHGFDPLLLDTPVIIADGLHGNHEVALPAKGRHMSRAHIAGDIAKADYLVTINHVKGHPLAGYGGCLKNLGMGCASRKGKMQQHMTTGPKVHVEHCVGCGACVRVCAAGALSLDQEKKVRLDEEKCVGCGACFHACTHHCLKIVWECDVADFLERMMEYAAALVLSRTKPPLHISFLTDITPECDCVPYSDTPICPNIGMLVSFDPVAIDQAALDLISQAPPLYPSSLPHGVEPGQDKFLAMRPHIPEHYGLDYAVELGLGSRSYKLVGM